MNAYQHLSAEDLRDEASRLFRAADAALDHIAFAARELAPDPKEDRYEMDLAITAAIGGLLRLRIAYRKMFGDTKVSVIPIPPSGPRRRPGAWGEVVLGLLGGVGISMVGIFFYRLWNFRGE